MYPVVELEMDYGCGTEAEDSADYQRGSPTINYSRDVIHYRSRLPPDSEFDAD